VKTAQLLLIAGLGLTLGNFVYQALTGQNWQTAVDRSYFQVFTLVCVWGMSKKPKFFFLPSSPELREETKS
jgi:hypothetical protein